MATISKKSVARDKAKSAAKTEAKTDTTVTVEQAKEVAKEKLMQLITPATTTSNVAPPENAPTLTYEEWLGLEESEDKSLAAAETATSHRIRGALLLMWSVPDHIVQWSAHWVNYRGKDQKKKADALDWFERDFRLPERKTLSGDPLKARDARRNRLLKSVEFCIELRKRGLLGSFRFNESGACFLASKSTLGLHVWKVKKWDQDKDLLAAGNDVQLVDRATTKNVAISWIELERIVIPKAGTSTSTTTTTTGATATFGDSAASTTATIRRDKPLDMIAEASKSLAAATDISMNDRQRFIVEMENNVAVMFKQPVYIEMRRAFETAFKAARDALGMKPRGAMGSGRPQTPPLNLAMVSPESVKTLPDGTAAVLEKVGPAKVVTAAELSAHRAAKAQTVETKAKPKRARR